MDISFFKKNWRLILLNLFILLIFILGYGRFGDIIVDSFREAYIPVQVAAGKILYKNIFTIYAPFSYLLNAVLFKIFGVKLGVLYAVGLFATFGIINIIYLISNKFIDKNCSFALILFMIAGCVLSPNVFNFFFPYSYGMIYGLLFICFGIYFGLEKKYPLAYLMYSFAVCSKYEFVFLLPLLIYASFSEWKKEWWKDLLCFITPFVLIFAPLFIQGVGIENLLTSFKIVAAMSTAKTLHWFYSITGLIFRWDLIPVYLFNIIKIAVPFLILERFKSYWLIPFIFVYLYFTVTPAVIIFAFPLILIMFVVRYRKLNSSEKFFIVASILISIKMFFALTLKAYGVYAVPFALVSIYILTPQKYRKTLFILTILTSLVLTVQNTKALMLKSFKIKTNRGVVYTTPYYGAPIKELTEFLTTSTAHADRVLVYPECLAVNFLTNRSSDNKFYSLIPLYVETFGENLIMDRLYITEPEYIIINNYDTSVYYYTKFGGDYAGRIMDYVKGNYSLIKTIGEEFKFEVYKINPHHPFP